MSRSALNVTSFDVARKANVSQSSVSRAFSPDASISKTTREKVVAAAKELGYVPNMIARGLTTRSTNMIGIVMSDLTNPFFPTFLDLFTAKLEDAGYRALLFSILPGDDPDVLLAQLVRYQVDGVILASATFSSKMATECRRLGIPAVLFSRSVQAGGIPTVRCDNIEGARKVASLFLEAGHERLAFIGGYPEMSTTQERLTGFCARLHEIGVELVCQEEGNGTYEGGFNALRRLMKINSPPEAIFVSEDIMALGAIDATRSMPDIRLGENLSIIGFDNIPSAAWAGYDLTTIRQPGEVMADATIQLLMESMSNPERAARTRLIQAEMVIRSSARLPPGLDRTDEQPNSYWKTNRNAMVVGPEK